MLYNDKHFSGATKALSLLFEVANHFVDNSSTGEYETTNETKYASIQETFVGNTPKCKKFNERLWIYNIVDFQKIPI